MNHSASDSTQPAGRYLMVVDSKTTDLFTCAMLLQRFGYRVCTANTSVQALDLISVAIPALVIADLYLPVITGIDLNGLLKQDPRSASVPVIILRPSGDESAMRRCLAQKITTLPKPIQVEDLYQAVQVAIESTPRSNIRIETRISVSVNNVPLDCIEGECASVLSEHGIYVRTREPHSRNEHVTVEMSINGRVIPAEATVLYSHRHGDGPFAEAGMGLKFLNIAPEDQTFIRKFIREDVLKEVSS
ncbi:MAG TPA: response regulator [Nitrospirota bacterium]|nr:response regulator [Nitrospirota bacterium]